VTAINYLKPVLIFLSVITYLGCLLFLSLKFPKRTLLSVELNTWISRPVFIGILIWLPISFFFSYYVIVNQDANFGMLFGILLPLIMLAIDFLFTNPKRKYLAKIADTKFYEIKLENENPQQSLNTIESIEIYNQDYPIYASGYLVGVALNRVCKNSYNEYFHIFCLYWKSWSEIEVRRIDKNNALVELNKKR
jgi:hypothetical protein